MSSIYNKYLNLKSKNNDTMYLFKIGKFYIFLDEDAEKINKITTLKLINHSKNVMKCGFPKESLEKYLDIFKNLNINIEIIDNEISTQEEIIKYLEKIGAMDIDEITPKESLDILYKLKELL